MEPSNPPANPAVDAVIVSYRSPRFTDAEWNLCGTQVRTTVVAARPTSEAAARIYLTALSAFLDQCAWNKDTPLDLRGLLTYEQIDAACEDPSFGSTHTRRQRRDTLRTLARAIGTGEPARADRAVVDLTPLGRSLNFTRRFEQPHADTEVVVSTAIDAYASRILNPTAWKLAADAAQSLVKSTSPQTVQAARVLLSNLCAFLSDSRVWDQAAQPELTNLLTLPGIGEHLRHTTFASAAARANRQKFLIALARAADSVPVAPPRRSQNIPVDPILAAGVTRRIPTVLVAAAKALTQDQPVNLDHIAREITRLRDLAANDNTTWTVDALAAFSEIASTTATTAMTKSRANGKPPSRRAALAAAKAAHDRAEELAAGDGGERRLPTTESVADEIRSAMERFVPQGEDRRAVWHLNRDLATRLVYAYQPSGPANARNKASFVAAYLTWAAQANGRDKTQPLQLTELLDATHVEAYLDASDWKGPSLAGARGVLRRIERNLRPYAVPVKIGHAAPRPPYTETECQEFVRLAWHQPTLTLQRRLGFIVALGLGAGLDAVDFRRLTPACFETVTIGARELRLVHVPGVGARARTVPVRATYVPLLDRALETHLAAGLGDDDLIVAHCETAVNVTTPTTSKVVSADGEKYRIITARLRHTWLVAAMCAPVSFADLMQAAGIRGARTVSELLEHCPAPDPATVNATYLDLTTAASRARDAR